MEFYLIPILSLCAVCLSIFFLIKKNKKYKELKNLQDEEIRSRFEQEFDKEINERKEGIASLEKEAKKIQQEISEKQNFNNSLFKIREDELNRLIEAKRQEKESALSTLIEKEKQQRFLRLDQEEKEKISLYTKQFDEFLEGIELNKQKYLEEINEVKKELNEYKSKRQAVNEQLRREEELANEIDFHRIVLNSLDKDDIHYLISIEQNIHNKEILYKLIWSEYIQKSFNQMIKNICGNKTYKNVIYCIENINNHKKYIGKTTADVSKRWTEHVKNSLNIGGIKRQLVHDAMFGHWDEFTFSILEEVKDEKLGEREKYYISFFETDKYGYNLKGGG